jgi:pentatricopeptide repeat protein
VIRILLSGYVKNNQASKAIDLFQKISHPNEVIVLLLFNACAQLQTQEALDLVKNIFANLPKSFRTHPHLITALFDAFVKCGDMKSAETVFEHLERSVISYGNLMSGFNHNERPEKTLELFDRMRNESKEPTLVIYLSVIKALAQLGDASLAKTIVEQMPKAHLEDGWIQNALIDMWVSQSQRRQVTLSVH